MEKTEFDVLIKVKANSALTGEQVADGVRGILDRGLVEPGPDDVPVIEGFEIESAKYAGDIRVFLANMTQIGWAIESGDIPQIAALWGEIKVHPMKEALGEDCMPGPWIESFLHLCENYAELSKEDAPAGAEAFVHALNARLYDGWVASGKHMRPIDVLSEWADEASTSIARMPSIEGRERAMDVFFMTKCEEWHVELLPGADSGFLADMFALPESAERMRA